MSIIALKNQARTTLQQRLSRPAFYIVDGASDLQINARLFTKWIEGGDLKAARMDGAVAQDITPKILFFRSEVSMPQRGAIVTFGTGDAYMVDNVLVPDGLSITAEVTPITDASDLANLTFPDQI